MSEIFVFGSNLAGWHSAGSAREAVLRHGAIYGQGYGPQGQSYAIPTKDENLKILPLDKINLGVLEFLIFAQSYPKHNFNVVAIGCRLARYKPEQIAPMFKNCPQNVKLPPEFLNVLSRQS